MEFCRKVIGSRSNFIPAGGHRCHLPLGHTGSCSEMPFLEHLGRTHPKVAEKIYRDATMTTGAAWKSKDAGPNRIRRWAMLLSDAELESKGVLMSTYGDDVSAKLRDKAASYEDCVAVAQQLTYFAYSMANAPAAPDDLRQYLEALFGPIQPGTTTCLVCMEPLDFVLFELARRGKAEIETGHSAPRMHNAANVGFAHRVCNIAQGARTLDQFYAWIYVVLQRVTSADRWRP